MKSGADSGKAGEVSFLIWYRTDTARYHEREARAISVKKVKIYKYTGGYFKSAFN